MLCILIPTSAYSYNRIVKAIIYSSKKYDIPVQIIYGVMREESDFNVNAVSDKGAVGLMQLMPATARYIGVDPYDPVQNVIGGVAYLRYCLNKFNGSYFDALSCYNAGPGNAERGYVSYNYIRNIVNFAERADR